MNALYVQRHSLSRLWPLLTCCIVPSTALAGTTHSGTRKVSVLGSTCVANTADPARHLAWTVRD